MAKPFPLRTISTGRFLTELHHLLWTEPLVTNGGLDEGWNCRDHAWTTAVLIKAAGHIPVVFHGEATFIGGRKAQERGIIIEQKPHTWCGVGGLGCIDVSIRGTGVSDGEPFRIPINCIFANNWFQARGFRIKARQSEKWDC